MSDVLRLHASAVAVGDHGALILGASGSGKSSLALRMMALGATLVADDQTELFLKGDTLHGRAPKQIAGLIEARGVGLLYADAAPAPITLAIDLDQTEADRLPPLREVTYLGVSLPCLHKVDTPAWPAALVQYLKAGRRDPS